MARGGADSSELVHDRAHHSVAIHGQNDFAHRAVGNDAHVAKGVRQRGLHLFYSGNFSDTDLRTLRLWLGLSHSCSAGLLWLAPKENGSPSEAVSIKAVGIRPAHRRAVHVCVANGISLVLEPGTRTGSP